MKQTFYFALFTLIFLGSTSCKKESLESASTPLPPTIIKTQGCFSPDCMTLLVVHPTDDFFYEDSEKYEIHWLKNGEFYKNGYQLSCTHSAIYKAVIRFIYGDHVRELTYELDLELTK